jgi:hypothetical protein
MCEHVAGGSLGCPQTSSADREAAMSIGEVNAVERPRLHHRPPADHEAVDSTVRAEHQANQRVFNIVEIRDRPEGEVCRSADFEASKIGAPKTVRSSRRGNFKRVEVIE